MRMPQRIFPLRLSLHDRQLFMQAARAQKKSLAVWLREAGHQRANGAKQEAACLAYKDRVVLSGEAERNPKQFIQSKLKARDGLHR